MNRASGPIASTAFGVLNPIEADRLHHRAGHYLDWWDRNRSATLPHLIEQLEVSGTIDNFRRLVGESDAPFRGMVFQDSDLYKTLESIAWTLGREEDEALRAYFDEMVALLARAQRPDGYLNSNYQREDRAQEPWSDFTHGHELYCLGHLLQAALAASRAMADDRLLAIATKNVELVIRLFGGPEATTKLPGHPEIEMALVELFRHTGDRRYLDLAKSFIDRRGHGVFARGRFGVQYYQDDTPVRETEIMRGHAVRALYLNSGVTDLYLETGETALLDSMRTQWHDLVTRRMYLTGGTGSRHRDEAFGDAYELPSDRAYSETCAGIALMGWAWRLFLATGDAAPLDEFERVLHNVVLSGVSDDGRAFFYANPLQRRPDHGISQEESAGTRLTWYECACCPPNLGRTFASLEHYVAAEADGEVRIAVYAPVEVEAQGVRLSIETAYPDEELIRISVTGDSDAALRLRLPGWTGGAFELTVDGETSAAEADAGWITLPDALHDGARIELRLPLATRIVVPHPSADAIRGSAAVMRGPVVYCAEQGDNEAVIDGVALVPDGAIDVTTGAEPRITVRAKVTDGVPDGFPLYAEYSGPRHFDRESPLVLRPYSSWGNSESSGAMRVWLPVAS